MYLIRRGNFRSRDKYGGHATGSPISENPMLRAYFTTRIFYRTGLPIKVLHCGNRDFAGFLLLWSRRWPDDLHIRTWPVSPENVPPADRKWTFYVKAFESITQTDIHTYSTCRQTDKQTQPKTLPRRFAFASDLQMQEEVNNFNSEIITTFMFFF